MAMESTMLALGTPAPGFDLPDTVSGGRVNLADLNAKALVVMFICNHCPYVKHVQAGLAQFAHRQTRRVAFDCFAHLLHLVPTQVFGCLFL